MWLLLGIILVLFIAILIIDFIACRSQKIERFEVPAKTITAAAIFAAHKMDEFDYKFIDKWKDIITFYVVVNGDATEWDDKIKNIDGVKYMNRENKGYDVYAWKAAMEKWNAELSQYDMVILMNNSCIYNNDFRDLLIHADGYDMFGLYPESSNFSLFFKNGVLPGTRNIQSYCIVIGKSLYNSDDFKKYWKEMPKITGHVSAVHNHEFRFGKHFDKLGYRIGVYIYPVCGEWVYDRDKRLDHDKFKLGFIKRKTVKNNQKVLNEFLEKTQN